jgi:hypothetical protein
MDSKLEDLLNSLETLDGRHTHEPETVATIKTAALALHFIQHVGRLKDFWEYARVFNTEEAWPKPLSSFARQGDGEWVLIRSPTIAELEAMEESEE